jgi:TPR repeat protein
LKSRTEPPHSRPKNRLNKKEHATMLQYSKPKDQEHLAAPDKGVNGLLDALANVTLEMGRGREVIVPDWLSNAVAAGKSEALTHLAGLHLGAARNGHGLAEAEPLLRQAAEKGYATAQEQLGIIGLFGLGRDVAPDEAASWLRLAADHGKKVAQSLLGMMLAAGVGIEQDLPEARQLLALAERQSDGFARTCLHSGSDLGLLPQIARFSLGFLRVLASVMASLPDDAGDVELQLGIAALANAGDADACIAMSALNYSAGNRAEALRWCLAAAGAGDELAVLMVGLLAFADQDDIRDIYPVVEWLDAAARRGSAPAQGLLGMMYATGRGVACDLPEANSLLGQAANGMDPSTEMGRLLGFTKSRSILEAIMHLFGNVLAAHLYGEGSAPSDSPFNPVTEAMRLAEQGDRFAQFFTAIALWSGQDVTQDRAESARWMREAAEQGHKEAQFFLGVCFDTGDGVERDREEAIRWFNRAAEQGHPAAQFILGNALLNGDGVEPNPAVGAHWLQLSAKQGNVAAQFQTGLCFLDGNGVEKDVTAGFRWLLTAADQGSQEARDFLGKIR